MQSLISSKLVQTIQNYVQSTMSVHQRNIFYFHLQQLF